MLAKSAGDALAYAPAQILPRKARAAVRGSHSARAARSRAAAVGVRGVSITHKLRTVRGVVTPRQAWTLRFAFDLRRIMRFLGLRFCGFTTCLPMRVRRARRVSLTRLVTFSSVSGGSAPNQRML